MTIFPSQRWQVNLKLTREVARVDVPTDEEALDDLGRNADLYAFHQDDADSWAIANKSTMLLLGLGVSYSLNRAKTHIIFSGLVLTKTKSRR